jgi:asparagine synthase (glutamine-hydrolysing)
MCGICGLVGSARERELGPMLELMEHRGPDDLGTFVSPHASIGARRLAIVDVPGGHQPALSEDGQIAAVLNGEIYNHVELRAALERRGHRLGSRSDTEVLPHLYEEYGPSLTSLLEGMFALAIWDERARRLVLARDRAGEKPLLYARTPSGLVFASELRALLAHPDVAHDIHPEALRLYLVLQYVPGPKTIVRGVSKLPPGHRLVAERGTDRVERYWDVAPSSPAHYRSRPGAVRELRSLLENAVASQMRADVPLGALLSGGIDSAGIVALMSQVCEGEQPRTFTVGFEDARVDARPAARVVAEHCRTRHTELVVGPPSFEQLAEMVLRLDEPVGDQAALPTFLIAKLASEHVTVVLTGEGSDELFGGYPRYGWFRLAERMTRTPGTVARAVHKLARAAALTAPQDRYVDLLLAPRSALARHVAWTRVFSEQEIDDLLLAPYRGAAGAEAVAHLEGVVAPWSDRPPLEQAMYLDLKTWLVDDILTKADRMSMAASIEARAPYLDRRVMELATSLPPEARLRGRPTKALLRAALSDLLPQEALGRRKQAFAVPVAGWLVERLGQPLRELLLASDAATAEVLDRAAVTRLLSSTGPRAARQLWSLGVLELWSRQLQAVTAGGVATGSL